MKVLNFVSISQELLEQFEEQFPEVKLYDASDPKVLDQQLSSVNIIFGNCPLKLIDRAENLEWIQIVSSGIDQYLPLADKDILVTTAKGLHWQPIAEYLINMMLLFTKNYFLFRKKQFKKEWFREPSYISLLAGQKVGIIGFGGIAKTLVKLVRPLQMEINAVTKNPPEESSEGVSQIKGMKELEPLLSGSDHIVLSLPLTKETKGFLNKNLIASIKEGAYLYNVSRGELLDEQALVKSLQENHLGGAALDVFQDEPLPAESPLWEMKNVIVTPHIAGHHKDLKDETFKRFRRNFERFKQGKPLKNKANFEKGY